MAAITLTLTTVATSPSASTIQKCEVLRTKIINLIKEYGHDNVDSTIGITVSQWA